MSCPSPVARLELPRTSHAGSTLPRWRRRPSRLLWLAGAGASLLLLTVPGVTLARDVSLTEGASGSTITASPGSGVSIVLESNASTGYHWIVSTAPSEQVLAELAGSGEYTAPVTDLIGAPGKQTFLYRAVAAGTTTLALDYVAPGTGAVGKSFTLTVRVGSAADAATPPATATQSGTSEGGASGLAIAAAGVALVGLAAALALMAVRGRRPAAR